MNVPKKSQKQFDLIIVGSGLAGLVLAKRALAEGLTVAVLEAQNTIGGSHSCVTGPKGSHDNTLHYLSSSSQIHQTVRQLNELLESPISLTSSPHSVLTFDDGRLKPFTSFGKTAPEFFEALEPYLQGLELVPNKLMYQWIKDLINPQLEAAIYPSHLASELVIENDKACGVMINGHHYWSANHVVFAASITDLIGFLPPDSITPRLRNHLKRPKLWTLVAVDFYHPELITTDSSLHLLNGTTQDDIGPCLGRFIQANASPDFQLSQWISFASDEDADESENIGLIIKKMKKQIKRAYPQAFTEPTPERIVVIPSSSGLFEDSQIKEQVYFKGIENFWLASAQLSSMSGLLRPVDQALRVANAIWPISERTTIAAELTAPPL